MNPYHFALVVGIGRYPGVSDLHGPVPDAVAVLDWLTDPDGGAVPPDNVEYLSSPSDPDLTLDVKTVGPTQRDIVIALTEINTRARRLIDDLGSRRAASRLYLYLAGHGIMPGAGQAALLTADARAEMYFCVDVQTMRVWYETVGIFRELVFFADCCRHSHPTVDASATLPELAIPSGEQVVAMSGYAAEPGLPAYEGPPGDRRGYFTRALIEGLRGKAAIDPRHGAITSTTLAEYMAVAVEDATEHKPFPQRVEMPSDPANPILFGARHQEVDITLHFPEAWTGAFDLFMFGGARQYCQVDGPTLTLRLRPGLYGVLRPGTWTPLFPHEGFAVVLAARDVFL